MPNHVHGIVWIRDKGERPEQPIVGFRRPARSLSSFIAQVKGKVTARAREMFDRPHAEVWQRGFFERIIRDDEELEATREYIRVNPEQWSADTENPDRP